MTIVVMGKMSLSKNKPFLEYDGRGEPKLAPWRQDDLDKELKQLHEAEQYALVATINGPFPCYNCKNSSIIFLHEGEIWKYGSTTKGEKGRYPGGLPFHGLIYVIEYKGHILECLEQEKIKIYSYPLLPENLKRDVPLIRPPGNKLDR